MPAGELVSSAGHSLREFLGRSLERWIVLLIVQKSPIFMIPVLLLAVTSCDDHSNQRAIGSAGL